MLEMMHCDTNANLYQIQTNALHRIVNFFLQIHQRIGESPHPNFYTYFSYIFVTFQDELTIVIGTLKNNTLYI